MGKFKNQFLLISIGAIIIGTISWAFYNLINMSVEDAIQAIARTTGWQWISNAYISVSLIIILGFVVLFLLGWSGKKILKGIIGG